MKQTQQELYKKLLDRYGEDNQLFQLFEELSELIKAVNKWRRNKGKGQSYIDDVAEEIADVEIMLDQLKIILEVPQSEILDWKYRKYDRITATLKENK